MYKVEFMFLSLTRVWLELNTQSKINAGTNKRNQTHVYELALSLTKNSTLDQKISVATNIQSPTHVYEFDLVLTKIQYSIIKSALEQIYKVKLIF